MPSLWEDDADVEEQPDEQGKMSCPLCRGFGIDPLTNQHCITCDFTGRLDRKVAVAIRDALTEGLYNEPRLPAPKWNRNRNQRDEVHD